MPRNKFNDVKIGERTFRIALLSALTADWIVVQTMGGRAGNPEVYDKIQRDLLSVCSVYKEQDGQPLPLPVLIFKDGKFLCPELELDTDLETIHALIDASMEFNVGPFLRKKMAEMEAAAGE